jgi:acetolactate synthase-1/2/3 large subunit
VSKKSECFRPEVRDAVDFVVTFEELAALFMAKNIDPASISEREELDEAIAAMKASEGAFLLEVRVEGEENIFPMVPAGAPVSEIRFE